MNYNIVYEGPIKAENIQFILPDYISGLYCIELTIADNSYNKTQTFTHANEIKIDVSDEDKSMTVPEIKLMLDCGANITKTLFIKIDSKLSLYN